MVDFLFSGDGRRRRSLPTGNQLVRDHLFRSLCCGDMVQCMVSGDVHEGEVNTVDKFRRVVDVEQNGEIQEVPSSALVVPPGECTYLLVFISQVKSTCDKIILGIVL